MKRGWRALLLLLLAISAVLAFAGCHDVFHDENDPDVDAWSGAFYYRADLDDFSAVEMYEWDTYHHVALVEFEAFDFDGEFRVEIYDDDGDLLYDRTFVGHGGYRYDFDDTARGDDGDWTVILTAERADGLVYLTID